MELKTLKLSQIKPYENNPRRNDDAVEAVAESIRQCEYIAPVIVDENNVILAGHTRYKALKKLGRKEAEVIIKAGLTEEQKRKYRLLDNKTNEFAKWDFDLLAYELDGLDFDGFDFGLDATEECTDEELEYETRKREFEERMASGELSEDSEEYQEFLAKFEPKKTTDDCYTPPIIYDAVADYVEQHYGLKKSNFVRPFYPGGDYKEESYKCTDVVVDNPPFSIMSEIIKWYTEKGIKFFLFAPHLTLFSSNSTLCACIVCGATVTYENGAIVSTSFVTNLEDCAFRSCPELYRKIVVANEENLKQHRKEMPKYSYPLEVVTSVMLSPYSRLGIEFEVGKSECSYIRQLDSQKESGKGLFGNGYLISSRKTAEREKAEREKAEREKAEVWQLSQREIEIVNSLE